MALMAVFLSSSRARASRLAFWRKKSKKRSPAKVATIISSIMVKPCLSVVVDLRRFISFIIPYFVI